MPMTPSFVIPAKAETQGLSRETQKLWLAAQRYRRLADALAVTPMER